MLPTAATSSMQYSDTSKQPECTRAIELHKPLPLPSNQDSSNLDLEASVVAMDRATSLDAAPAMQIVFRNLTYTVQIKEKVKGVVDRAILKGLKGVIEPSRTTAVMGASGAGKTTMLNVLAGYVSGNAKVTGTISVNGTNVNPEQMRKISGFVHQEDVILDTMTVREALLFAAMLKLPGEMPTAEKQARALDIAALLNLTKSLDNIVGSAMIKGISGGEKRRLSLGMEMITNPSILFLDEPTSGLDTYTAFKVAKILASVAHRHHRTMICTIHQPSSDIFYQFDDLLVLSEGQIMYHGPANEMVDYFTGIGYPCPQYTNPADFLFMDILNVAIKHDESAYDFVRGTKATPAQLKAAASTSDLPSEGQPKPADARVEQIVASWQKSSRAAKMNRNMSSHDLLANHGVNDSHVLHAAPFWLQFMLLAARSARNQWRNSLILKAKVAQTIVMSLIVGLTYLKVTDSYKGVQDRQGSLFFIIMQCFFGSVLGTLTVFGAEKAVFSREFGSRLYGLPAYFYSRWIVELPSHLILPVVEALIVYWMVGYQNVGVKVVYFALAIVLVDNCGAAMGMFIACIFNDLETAMAVTPMFLLPLMIFSGFFVNSETLPRYFFWIGYLSPMRYGFIVMAKTEFDGLEIRCSPDDKCKEGYNGQDVINTLGFDNVGPVGEQFGILLALVVGLVGLSHLSLWVAVRKVK